METKTENKDEFIITKRIMETYLVAGARDATQAKELFAGKKCVLIQSNENIVVGPRSTPESQDKPAPATGPARLVKGIVKNP